MLSLARLVVVLNLNLAPSAGGAGKKASYRFRDRGFKAAWLKYLCACFVSSS